MVELKSFNVAPSQGNVIELRERDFLFELIPLRKGGIRGLCFFPGLSPFSRGQVYNPLAPFIKGDFYIHYLLIRINKMKIPIQFNYKDYKSIRK